MRIIAPDVHRSFAQMAILENGTLRDAGTVDLERSRLLWVAQAPGASPRTGTGTPSAKAAGTPVMPTAASALCSVLRNNSGRRHRLRSAVLALHAAGRDGGPRTGIGTNVS